MSFTDNLNKKRITKGELLLRAGEKCLHGYFVVSGCLKSYVIDKNGKEHILQFAPENWMVSDLDSFVNDVPSTTFIEAVENTEVKLLPRSFFDKSEHLNQEELYKQNQRLIKNIIVTNKRLAAVFSATAKERYLTFCETYPNLIQRLPLKLIAAYIGITPEYLSEIRREIATN